MSFDPDQDVDHAEHAAFQPCPDCGGPQYDGEHDETCPTLARTRTAQALADLPNRMADRYGRPLPADPEATEAPTRPVGVHIIPMTWTRYALADLANGGGISWLERGHWTTEHILAVERRDGSRWHIGYLDDTAIVNHGQGRPRTKGRSLFAFADSSCIAAHPEMGTAADIRRWQARGQWHEAAMGDLVILQCIDPAGKLVETVAAKIVSDGWSGSHLTLALVEHEDEPARV